MRPAAAAWGAVALGLLFGPPAAALDPARLPTQYRHDHWHIEQGLPQSSVEALLQTRDGYLWLGTQEGLARFDGVRFTVFDRSNTPALKHNRVVALYEDRAGIVWIGTEGGGLTRYKDGAFRTWTSQDGLPNDRVRSIAEGASGRLWIGTDDGLAILGPQGGGFVRSAGFPGGAILALRPRASGGVWVGTEEGLAWAEGREGAATKIAGLDDAVLSIREAGGGVVWAGTRRGLFRVRGTEVTPYGSTHGVPAAPVHAVVEDRDGNLWVAVDGHGVVRIHDDGVASLTTRDGLANARTLCLQEDREGSLWIGMQDGGLDRLADGKFVTWTTREGLPEDIVWPVFGDPDGTMWLGTSASGLARFRDGRFTHLTRRDGLSSDSIQAIVRDGKGALWIGTRDGGLDRLVDGRVRVFTARDGLPGDSVTALWPDADGTLWVGTRGGLTQLKGGRAEAPPAVDPLRNVAIHDILRGRSGELWIATNGSGLARLDGTGLTRFTTDQGLTSDIVDALHEDADGTLWIGTYGGGLVRRRAGRFASYTTANGLFDDAVFSILDDGLGNLWMSSNKGVFRVSRREIDDLDSGRVRRLRPVAYGTADGMKSRECNGANQPAAWRAADGRLWFPTIRGAATIDPARVPANSLAPSVLVESLLVEGEPVVLRNGLEIGPGKDSLEIRYTATSLLVPERVRFRYKLEGFDRDWVDAGARRVAYYTRVPPGAYRFSVTASNDDGVWSEGGAGLSFRVRPPYYRMPWFVGLAALAALGLAAAAYRLQVRRVHAHEATLMRLVDERTRELEEANRSLARLSSLDGLTGLLNRRAFDEVLASEWRRAQRAEAPVSLILADIDSFKAYNDTYGHQGGDDCLRWVARTLTANFGRAGDFAARYGGEEFVVLLPGTRTAQALALAERLRSDVESLGILHEGARAAGIVTLSAGIATRIPREGSTPEGLVEAADRALYEAKERGRNRVVAADDRVAADGPGE